MLLNIFEQQSEQWTQYIPPPAVEKDTKIGLISPRGFFTHESKGKKGIRNSSFNFC